MWLTKIILKSLENSSFHKLLFGRWRYLCSVGIVICILLNNAGECKGCILGSYPRGRRSIRLPAIFVALVTTAGFGSIDKHGDMYKVVFCILNTATL